MLDEDEDMEAMLLTRLRRYPGSGMGSPSRGGSGMGTPGKMRPTSPRIRPGIPPHPAIPLQRLDLSRSGVDPPGNSGMEAEAGRNGMEWTGDGYDGYNSYDVCERPTGHDEVETLLESYVQEVGSCVGAP